MVSFLLIVFVATGSAQLQNFKSTCRLDPHPSVEYHCLLSGGLKGSRICSTDEPAGTKVSPRCRLPNYFSSSPLAFMRCFDGYWDYIARCSPECGRVTPDGKELVVGGATVKRGELPWHAGIYRTDFEPYMQVCGGSLISTNVVLSAAHCFWTDLEKQQPASKFSVAVGKLYRSWNDQNDQAQKSSVKVIHLPPAYQGAGASFQDDIAVVVVARHFTYQPHVRPVCLSFDYQFEQQQLYSGNKGKVAGWGLTAAGKASPVLQVIDLPYVEVGTCINKSPSSFREYITSDKICAGTLTSESALCRGDSGGGLAYHDSSLGIERYYLRGVASTAASSVEYDACNTNSFTTFTSVRKHEDFIKDFWSESGQFKCQDGTFISAANYCDGSAECEDRSDETEWACSGKTCGEYLFRCEYGACVDRGAACNGVRECLDGSDEAEAVCAAFGTNKPLSQGSSDSPGTPALSHKPIDRDTLISIFGYDKAKEQALTPINNTIDDFSPANIDYDAFDWILTKQVASSSEENFLLSPLGLKMVLSMLIETATGLTQTELFSALGVDDRYLARKKFASIIESLKEPSREYILNLGNIILMDNDFEPRPRFIAIAQEFYKTDLTTIDFSKPAEAANQINAWVSNVAKGRISGVVNEGDVANMVVLILNTLYFKGSWRHQFAPTATVPGWFSVSTAKQVTVPFMNTKDNFYYTESTKYDAKILRMPYRVINLAMYLIVPNSIAGLPRVLNGLSELRLELDNLSERMVDVTIPKFKFDFTSQLDGVLQELGVRTAFKDEASFPGLSKGQKQRRLKISKILLLLGIEVNEVGSIPYAANGLDSVNQFGKNTTSTYEVIANRPFLFFIQDEPTRQLLFTGRVSNPAAVDGAFKLSTN